MIIYHKTVIDPVFLSSSDNMFWNAHSLCNCMWCDHYEPELTKIMIFRYTYHSKLQYSISFVFEHHMTIPLEPNAQFWWGFHQNIALNMRHTLQIDLHFNRVKTHCAWLHHIFWSHCRHGKHRRSIMLFPPNLKIIITIMVKISAWGRRIFSV